MLISGLDLSLTATGIADASGQLHVIKPGGRRGTDRLAWLKGRILDLILGSDLAVLEGYAYAAKGSSVFQLGELGGVIRLALHEHAIPFAVVPPFNLKQYATGKAIANKVQVALACQKRLGLTPEDDNAADAAWLKAMAEDVYSVAAPAVPSSHRAALAKVTWPPVAERLPFAAPWRTPA